MIATTAATAASSAPKPTTASASGAPAGDHFALPFGAVRLRFGAGSLDTLDEVAAHHGRRALIVTDPGVIAAGHVDRAAERLRLAGLEVTIYDGVRENPTELEVLGGLDVARAHEVDLLVAVGGGSSMDCAKGINFLLAGGGSMEDYWGDGRALGTLLPSVGVPTTAGTGSEAQRFALISRNSDHRKMACGDEQARFRDVLLDPDLLTTVPRLTAAHAGIDAVSHAIESLVTTRGNRASRLYSREAWRLLERSLEAYLDDPARDDEEGVAARGDVALGSHLGGAAIEASMLGAAHACANPLTARFDIVHGAAVGLMLPHVVRFNAAEPAVAGRYAEIVPSGPETLARRLSELLAAAGLPATLEEHGVDRATLDDLAADAAEQWTGQHNPRPVDAASLRGLYNDAFSV
ncbi:MAG: iron-containing alcohol dehydrogenase [Acidobacteriota bacterium]